MTSDYVKHLIEVNKFANAEITQLEGFVKVVPINNDKDKANFGNACVMLRGYRMIADASEAMLINENVLKGEDGEFYQKIENDIIPPSTKGTLGSDYDSDKKQSNE